MITTPDTAKITSSETAEFSKENANLHIHTMKCIMIECYHTSCHKKIQLNRCKKQKRWMKLGVELNRCKSTAMYHYNLYFCFTLWARGSVAHM